MSALETDRLEASHVIFQCYRLSMHGKYRQSRKAFETRTHRSALLFQEITHFNTRPQVSSFNETRVRDFTPKLDFRSVRSQYLISWFPIPLGYSLAPISSAESVPFPFLHSPVARYWICGGIVAGRLVSQNPFPTVSNNLPYCEQINVRLRSSAPVYYRLTRSNVPNTVSIVFI